jgi:hypothetical protein
VVWRSSSTAWRTASAEAKKRIPFARVDLDSGAVTGIAFGSLIVALFALAWTVYRDIATRSDVRQERTDRKDQLAREEGRREEEIRLLRLQVERQSKSNEATAELVGKSTGWSGDSTGVTFPMSVRNVGSGVARDVIVWLALATDMPTLQHNHGSLDLMTWARSRRTTQPRRSRCNRLELPPAVACLATA